MSDNYDSMLGGRVTPSASFKGQFPITWDGVIEDVTKNPAYEYDPSKSGNRGAQKFWPDGNPVLNVWITLKTNVRTDPEDDGRRVLVLDSKNKLEAVQNAVRESRSSFLKGARLLIEWYGNDPNGKNPDNPPKLYRAQYTPPTLDAMLDSQAPPTQAAPAPAWGQQAPAPAPAAPATGGWGSPPAVAQAAPAWGVQPAAPATTPAASPTVATAGWSAPAAPAPVPAALPDPWAMASQVHPELVEALRKKGIAVPAGATQADAEGAWEIYKGQPDVA